MRRKGRENDRKGYKMERTKELRNKLFGLAGMIVLACAMFLHFSIIGFAAEGKVTADSAKIRKEASTSSEMVGGALRGEKYTITEEVTGADGYVWYKITFDGNKTGYIRSDLMEKSSDGTNNGGTTSNGGTINPTVEVTEVQPVSATITGSSVRVRSDASTSGSILAGVVRDSVVTITGQAQDTQGKTWYRVTFSSESGEITGFIREDFLSVSGTITPVEDTPAVSEPGGNDPVVSEPEPSDTPEPDTPAVIINDFEVIEEGGVWKLVDNTAGKKYNAAALIEANEVNPPKIEELQKKVGSQKGWIIFLVILVVVLGVLVTLLFLKVKDVMDEAYFTAVEKETIRQRQGQKANNSAAKSKSVMHTLGAGGNTVNKQGVPKAASVPKPNGTTGSRPMQQKSQGTAPQTVKGNNPSDARAARPAGQQQRPVGQQSRPAQQKPVNAQNPQRAAAPNSQQARAAAPNSQQARAAAPNSQQARVAAPGSQQQRPVQQRPAENMGKQSWQSKNFVADEDDDFEFEFLNWDGNEEN